MPIMLFLFIALLPSSSRAEWVVTCGTKNQSEAQFFLQRSTQAEASAAVYQQCLSQSRGQRCAQPICKRYQTPDLPPARPYWGSDANCKAPYFWKGNRCITTDPKIVAEAWRRERDRRIDDWFRGYQRYKRRSR